MAFAPLLSVISPDARYVIRGSDHLLYFPPEHPFPRLLPGLLNGAAPAGVLSMPYHAYATALLDIVFIPPLLELAAVASSVVTPRRLTAILSEAISRGLAVKDYCTPAFLRQALRKIVLLDSADVAWRTVSPSDLYSIIQPPALTPSLQIYLTEPLSTFRDSNGFSTRLRQWLVMVQDPFMHANWAAGGSANNRIKAVDHFLKASLPYYLNRPPITSNGLAVLLNSA
jgi:hypothetical protein